MQWHEEPRRMAEALLEDYPDVPETMLDGIDTGNLTCGQVKVWLRKSARCAPEPLSRTVKLAPERGAQRLSAVLACPLVRSITGRTASMLLASRYSVGRQWDGGHGARIDSSCALTFARRSVFA